jgi:hypothetical protein
VTQGFPRHVREVESSGGYGASGTPPRLSVLLTNFFKWVNVDGGDEAALKGYLAFLRVVAYFEIANSHHRYWALVDKFRQQMFTLPEDEKQM